MTDLGAVLGPEWTYSLAVDVNERGQVAGTARSSGPIEAVRWTLPG
jgi:hypothetical protein